MVNTEIRLIIFIAAKDEEALYSQQKQDRELTVAQIMDSLECPLDCKEIQPVHSEGDQPWDFFGRKDAKAETPVLWPPHAKG